MRRPPSACPRVRLAVAVVVACLLVPTRAFAGDTFTDPYDLPDTPRAPTLPELTHGEVEITSEATLGVLSPTAASDGSAHSRSFTLVERIAAEAPIYERRWFVGGQYEFTTGSPPFGGGSAKLVGGNLELYGRTVWANRTGLAIGAGLGLVAPTAFYDEGSPAERVASAAASVRPWDHPMFLSGYITARPFIDVRAVDGRFVIQFRQGLDGSLDIANRRSGRIAAIAALYMGYNLADAVGVGFEVFEYYFLRGPVADDRRVNLFLSPSLRLLTKGLQPALSVYHSLGTPLDEPNAPVSPVWGVRLAFTVVLDPLKKGAAPTP